MNVYEISVNNFKYLICNDIFYFKIKRQFFFLQLIFHQQKKSQAGLGYLFGSHS